MSRPMKVLEIGSRSFAVRYVGRILMDFGADVRFVGDASASMSERSAWDLFLDDGKIRFDGLADWIPDVVVTASPHQLVAPTDAVPRNCLEAREWWPQSLTVCVTDFGQGQEGPGGARGSAAVAALCGLVDATPGYPDTSSEGDAPVISEAPLVDLAAAIVTVLCVHAQRRTWGPNHIEVSMLEAATAFMVHEWGITAYTGQVQGRRPGKPLLEPNLCLDTRTGRAVIAAITESQWEKLASLLGLADEPAFSTLVERRERVDELHARLRELLADADAMELTRQLQGAGVPSGTFLDVSDALRLSEAPLQPAVDEPGVARPPLPVVRRIHVDSTRATSIGDDRVALPTAHPDKVDALRPLAGVTVLDLGRMKAAPFTGMLLAALGADVIVLETVRHSVTRGMGPYLSAAPSVDQSAAFNMVNRGKRSRKLDLRSETGRREFERLVADADVVLENFSDSGSRHLRLTLADLAEINPSILLASIRGFGEATRWKDWLALHSSVIALSGLGTLTRDDSGVPRLIGALYPDMLAGGLLAACVAAELGGGVSSARQVKVNMFELLLYAMGGSVVGVSCDRCVPVDVPVRAKVVHVQDGFAVRGEADDFSGGAWQVPVRSMLDVLADPLLVKSGFVVEEDREDLKGVPVPAVPWIVNGKRFRLTSAPTLERTEGEA